VQLSAPAIAGEESLDSTNSANEVCLSWYVGVSLDTSTAEDSWVGVSLQTGPQKITAAIVKGCGNGEKVG